ncbi:MAG: hypothetical protein ACJA08_000199 [Cyclobacteriaceae bacterium]|jgi:hypothetical protein
MRIADQMRLLNFMVIILILINVSGCSNDSGGKENEPFITSAKCQCGKEVTTAQSS